MDATEAVVTLTDMHLDHTGRILVAVASVYRTVLGNKQTKRESVHGSLQSIVIVLLQCSTESEDAHTQLCFATDEDPCSRNVLQINNFGYVIAHYSSF